MLTDAIMGLMCYFSVRYHRSYLSLHCLMGRVIFLQHSISLKCTFSYYTGNTYDENWEPLMNDTKGYLINGIVEFFPEKSY